MHSCINGFSRRLIWLEVNATNKNPKVIAHYHFDAVKQIGGCPDDGSENSLIEAMHTYLCSTNSGDDNPSDSYFAIGRSTAY